MSATRRARVRALAKINLDLRVLGKRPDGFHELRTVFQTVSLADTLDIAFTPGRRSRLELIDEAGIPGNLVVRAAEAVIDAAMASGSLEMRLTKRIPMGAGLGGGSSDAAAVLLALPVLAGRKLGYAALAGIAERLGSDVPFFLQGGAAVGIGRGTELFPLPDEPVKHGVLVVPEWRVNTPQAYADLSPCLTTESQQNKIFSFQSHIWNPAAGGLAANDFEAVVSRQHSRLAGLKRDLLRAGASVALMSGSGSAVFGLCPDGQCAARAVEWLNGPSGLRKGEKAFRISLVGRARYRRMWRRSLEEHSNPETWPPQTRYKT